MYVPGMFQPPIQCTNGYHRFRASEAVAFFDLVFWVKPKQYFFRQKNLL